jgi:hypothetical protein
MKTYWSVLAKDAIISMETLFSPLFSFFLLLHQQILAKAKADPSIVQLGFCLILR